MKKLISENTNEAEAALSAVWLKLMNQDENVECEQSNVIQELNESDTFDHLLKGIKNIEQIDPQRLLHLASALFLAGREAEANNGSDAQGTSRTAAVEV